MAFESVKDVHPPEPITRYESVESKQLSPASETLPRLRHGSTASEPEPIVGAHVAPRFTHEFWAGAHHKEWEKSPWVQLPLKEEHGRWISEDQQATEWLSLFYDLVVVAVLSVFSASHELASVQSVPNFLGFFTILYWVWVSQTHYDMRFQANDALNRVFKLPQICVFIYQGATSGNWNPSQILRLDPSTVEGAEHMDNYTSFNGVVIALIVSRALLTVQFLIAAYLGRRVGRGIVYLKRTIAALLLSLACSVAALAIPPNTPRMVIAQIVFLYLGLLIEALDVFAHIVYRPHPPFETKKLGERYGAFTLVILGEGMISLTRAFNWTISGLSFYDALTYVKVFLGILIIYLLWGFLFARFDQCDAPSHSRALGWTIIHFPLAFGLLLLLASLVNTTLTVACTRGMNAILEQYQHIITIAKEGRSLMTDDYAMINQHFRKLELQPDFITQYSYISSLFESSAPSDDPLLISGQYLAQIVWETYWLYGIQVPDHAGNVYNQIDLVNTTWTGNTTVRGERLQGMVHLLDEFISEPLDEAFSGLLWLIPVAGIVLMLCAVRSMLWYRFNGAAHWIIHGPQMMGGFALAMLGLLDLGDKSVALVTEDPVHIDLARGNPLYKVVAYDVPLALVAGVYLLTYLGGAAALHVLASRRLRQHAHGPPRQASIVTV